MTTINDEAIERRVRGALEHLKVTYQILPCDPDLADTAVFCDHYGIPLENSANTIVVASKKEPKRHSVCLVLATTRLDVNHKVRELMGVKKLSFASPEETVALTGMMVGGVTPFGLPESLPIYIDARVMEREYVVLGGGSRSCKISLAPGSLTDLPQATVVAGLAMERDADP